MRKAILLLSIVFLLSSPARSAVNYDEFGGWADFQTENMLAINRNADGSAHATSVTATTLTDTTQNWATDEKKGCILQPKVGTHMYFLIVSNTSNTVTAVEADRTGDNYRGVDDYNDGNDEYRILNNWPTEKISRKWWLIDGQDNVFLIKGMNNLWDGQYNNGYGTCSHGYSLHQNLINKYGDRDGVEAARLPSLRAYGFNCLAQFFNPELTPGNNADVTSDEFVPFIQLLRPSVYWTLTNTEKLGSSVFYDVFDPDFPSDMATKMAASNLGDGFIDMGDTQQDYHITPYKNKWLNYAASPYAMGIFFEDEPSRHTYSHEAFLYFVGPMYTTAGELSQTKAYFTNKLRAQYTDGGEDTFVANIAFAGSDEITLYSAWSGVTGYVSAAKDTAALENLNAEWLTEYASWEEVYKEDNSDPDDTKTGSSNITFADNDPNPDTIVISGDTWSFSPTPGYIKVSGTTNNNGIFRVSIYSDNTFTLASDETLTNEASTSAVLDTVGEIYGRVLNRSGTPITSLTPTGDSASPYTSESPQILVDLDSMSTDYWKRAMKTYKDIIDAYTYGKKMLVTFKIAINDYNLHSQKARWMAFAEYVSAMTCFTGWDYVKEWSALTDTPVWNNSTAATADIDSPRGARGIVDEVKYTSLITGVTDASGNTGTTVIDTDTSDTVVVDRSTRYGATTLYIGDNACNTWCGTVFCNTTADPDICSRVAFLGKVSSTQITLVDSGVTGNSIAYELRSYNILYDADQDFTDPWEHANQERRLWWVANNPKSIAPMSLITNENNRGYTCRTQEHTDSDPINEMHFDNYCTGGYYTCMNTTGRYCYGERCINLNDWLPAGTEYGIAHGIGESTCPSEPLAEISQEDRGIGFKHGLREWYQMKNNDGDYIFLGFAWFDLWDFGTGDNENYNSGWFTQSDNAYDGVEATLCGADGICGGDNVRDDEMANFGNSVKYMSQGQNNIYPMAGPITKVPLGAKMSGVSFR